MLTIRRYDRADQKAVKDLIQGILTKEFSAETHAYPTQDLEDILSSYSSLGEAFFVATEANRIIGTVAVKREDERIAFLRRLFVLSEYRHRKIGSALIDHAIQFCKEAGYDEIVFKTTSTMRGAIGLCEQKGFVPRARLDLGPIQLLKYALFLKPEVVLEH